MTNNRLSHTAKPSAATNLWHRVSPIVPRSLRTHIRKNLQFIHSHKLTKEDALLLSYPKSGSTWLRTMLHMALVEGPINANDLAQWIPPLHMASSRRMSVPRIVRSHDSINTPGFKQAGRALILVRDPRSVVVSYHHHQLRRSRDTTLIKCTEELLSQGFDYLGSWQSHAKAALKASTRDNVKIIRYEDLLANSESTLQDILEFYDINLSKKRIAEIVEESRPEKMKNMRIKSGLESNLEGDSDIRSATLDSWKKECSPECQHLISSTLSKSLKSLGYET